MLFKFQVLLGTFIKAGMTKEELKTLKEEDEEIREYAQKNLGYFIAYENLFSSKNADRFVICSINKENDINKTILN